MPVFVWEARDRTGATKRGTMDAERQDLVLARLKAEQLQVVSIKQQGGGALDAILSLGGGVPVKDLVIFTRQFATMIDSGLPLVQCLDILSNQTENKAFAKALGDVKSHVESGGTFSDALRRHPKIFDELYDNLIAAGEAGGILDTILNRLGSYIEKAMKLKQQVKSAMTYPVAILVVAIIIVIVMLYKVIPTFENMFKEMKAGALPGITQFVINLSKSFQNYWYVFIGGLAALVVGFRLFVANEKGHDLWDGFLLKIPIIGDVLRKTVVARFARTLGTLLSSGVPILDALDIVAKTAGNRVVKYAILNARAKIAEGKDMATPLGATGVFPPMVVQMIGVGEQTGAMDAMLSKIADFYEDEVDVAVAGLMSLIEPFMMVFLGVVVGGLMLSMYLPIFSIAGSIKAD